jgi:hypothetical protein
LWHFQGGLLGRALISIRTDFDENVGGKSRQNRQQSRKEEVVMTKNRRKNPIRTEILKTLTGI